MTKTKAISIGALLILISLPLASAIDIGDTGIPDILAMLGKMLEAIQQNPQSQVAALFILFFVILYGILSGVLKRMKMFEGEGGLGMNTQGNMVALAMAGITCMAIFFADKQGPEELLKRIFNPFG